MNYLAIISIKHFAAFNQVMEDYKLLLFYESELGYKLNLNRKSNNKRIKNEIILLLKRVIENKNILNQNTSADEEYLSNLIESEK
jgi:hypothetical protein